MCENLLSFSDFDKNWKAKKAEKTKRTEIGLDILKENTETTETEKSPELEQKTEHVILSFESFISKK